MTILRRRPFIGSGEQVARVELVAHLGIEQALAALACGIYFIWWAELAECAVAYHEQSPDEICAELYKLLRA